jgi:hypothetical protein
LRLFALRELVAPLLLSRSWRGSSLSVGPVILSSNRVSLELIHGSHPHTPLWLDIEERSGWLLARLRTAGWLRELPVEQRNSFSTALGIWYKLAGVELVEEQLEANLPTGAVGFTLDRDHLIVWADHRHGQEAYYNLRDPDARSEPRNSEGVRIKGWPMLDRDRLVYARAQLFWQQCVESWQQEEDGKVALSQLNVLTEPALTHDVRTT